MRVSQYAQKTVVGGQKMEPAPVKFGSEVADTGNGGDISSVSYVSTGDTAVSSGTNDVVSSVPGGPVDDVSKVASANRGDRNDDCLLGHGDEVAKGDTSICSKRKLDSDGVPVRKSGRERKSRSLKELFPGVSSLFHGQSPRSTAKPNSKIYPLRTEPNIYFVNDFLTGAELKWFDQLCTDKQFAFHSSFTEADCNERVISDERTSTFIHLTKGCDATIRSVERRAADLIGVGSEYVEPLQIVSYTEGQQFKVHHDAGTLLDDGSVEIVSPRRMATLFVYLNTLPEGQGHTEFPDLGLSVQPKAGCAVLFGNMMPDGAVDTRTVHQACPVEGKLKKFGINVSFSMFGLPL
jgi:hypothetical protein